MFERVGTSLVIVSFLVGGHLADRCGEVWTGADSSDSWVSLLVGGHLADRCGQVWTTLVTGCLCQLADT